MQKQAYYLYRVEHPLGVFIGVAKNMEDAVEHFGKQAVILPITDERQILEMRLDGPDRVLLAI